MEAFSVGLLKDRPQVAPDNSIYYATDTKERYRFLDARWTSLGKVGS